MIKRGSERAMRVVPSLPGEFDYSLRAANGFDGAIGTQYAVPSICKRLMASRDMSAGGGHFGRRGGTR